MDFSLTALMNRLMPTNDPGAKRAYQLYLQEAQALGQQPVPMDQWMVLQKAGKIPAQTPAPIIPQQPAVAPAAPVTPNNPAGIQF